MKLSLSVLAFISMLIVSLCHAKSPYAAPVVTAGQQAADGEPVVTVTVAPWLTAAAGQWEVQGVTKEGLVRSRLEWDQIDSALLMVKGRLQILPFLALGGSYGCGNLFDGRNTDSDSIQPPLSLDAYLFSRSESDTSGDTQLYDLNLYLDLLQLSRSPHPAGQRLEVFVGYQDYRDRLTDQRGVQTFSVNQAVYLPFSDQGVNARYEFRWQAARLGVQGMTPVARRVTISGSAALLALVQQDGDGSWTMRADLRQNGPNIHNESRDGGGFDLDGALSFALTPFLDLTAGLRWIALANDTGVMTLDYADGSSGQMTQTSISSSRIGVYAGLTAKF